MSVAFTEQMTQLAYATGRYEALVDAMLDDFHRCEQQHLRYPWPPDPACDACRRTVERFVGREYMEMAYRLWGWDAMVEAYEREIQRRIAQAEANRRRGAYI